MITLGNPGIQLVNQLGRLVMFAQADAPEIWVVPLMTMKSLQMLEAVGKSNSHLVTSSRL